MKEGINKPRYIIADDFTGANDIGVALATTGVSTKVLLPSLPCDDDDFSVGVICTNSRDLGSIEAQDVLETTSNNYQLTQKQPLLIKKIDSTLRGNVGVEIQALLNTGYKLIIVAIAAPFAKRKTLNGLCYVNDIPLSQTEFASDPKSPIHSSRIKDIISSQTNANTQEYLLTDHNNEPHEHNFIRLYDSGAKIIVCDAQSHDELFDLYQAANHLNVPSVFVTTGELTYSLVDKNKTSTLTLQTTEKPTLAIVGSMSEMTLTQSQYLIDHNEATVIDIELTYLLAHDYQNYLKDKSAQAINIMKNGENCLIRSCKSVHLRHELHSIATQHHLSQKQLANHVRDCLSTIATLIVTEANHFIGGIILCGGDVAIATAHKLQANSYQIGGMIADCVPWGIINNELTPFPIFTKAGGFGNPATFSQVIQQLHKEVR